MNPSNKSLSEAIRFINDCYEELNLSEETKRKRISEIEGEINHTGTYSHTHLELTHGAKMA